MDVLADLIDAACDQRGCAINNNGDKGGSQDNYDDTPDPRIHYVSLKSDKVFAHHFFCFRSLNSPQINMSQIMSSAISYCIGHPPISKPGAFF